MSIIPSLLIVKKIHDYISKKATGNRRTFARKLNMSDSTLDKYLREMKTLKFPIQYDKIKETYYYTDDTDSAAMLEGFHIAGILGREDMKQCNIQTDGTVLPSYYLCIDEETGRRVKSDDPC